MLVSKSVLERMESYRQNLSSSNESGGLLLGYRRGPHLEIVDITIPFSGDVQKRSYFYRCDSAHEHYAYEKWKGSGNEIDYLGEWHTHPESLPTPSDLDMREWKNVVGGRAYAMTFFIIGTVDTWVGVGDCVSIKSCNVVD